MKIRLIRTGRHKSSTAPVTIKPPRSPKSNHGYTVRNENLRSLGFRSYGEYIHSDMWKLIRGLAFEANGTTCVSCNATATQIHHASYDLRTLAGSDMTHLHPVCGKCHEAAEIVDGDKTHHKAANATLGVRGLTEGQQRRERIKLDRAAKAFGRKKLRKNKTQPK
jgi:hypothetical protein